MTIPRQVGPETGPRAVLPDYSRSNATVERMVSDLHDSGGRSPRRATTPDTGAAVAAPVQRILEPRSATLDTAVRAAVSALLLGTAFLGLALAVALLVTGPPGRSPTIGTVLIVLALGLMCLLCTLLGLRFGIVALGTARARVEISEDGLRVVGALRSRLVTWAQIEAVESRVVHPVHWLTAALRLQDGSRVIMPAFDRHVWHYTSPSGEDVRSLRRELRRLRPGAGRA